MRFKRHLVIEHGLKNIYIAPLLNVILLLCMFFILTSGLSIQSGMKVSLPKALTSGLIRPERVEFYISEDDRVFFNGSAVTDAELKEILRQIAPRNPGIIIRPAKRASFAGITKVWDTCRSSGIYQISLESE